MELNLPLFIVTILKTGYILCVEIFNEFSK